LRARHVPKDEQARAVADAAAMLGLDGLLDRRPRELSGGQRQRVALARAIVRRPSVFLMDEPLSNLDAKMRTQTRAELVELQQRLGTTFVYVTHDQVEAMTMGHRVAVLESGRLQQVGPPQEVYDRPANVFVARFIGSPPMNTVDGELADEGDVRVVRTPAGDVVLPPSLAATTGAVSGRRVVLGVRPEHVALGERGLAATVRLVESLGHERHVVGELDGGGTAIVRLPSQVPVPTEGATVRLATTSDEHLHLFDGDTGLRVDR
jgi:multiple sugar transport system ATP-binding protein